MKATEVVNSVATRELIDVRTAEKWLESTPAYQRKIDAKQVRKLVRAIIDGQWRENGATIVFNAAGDLIDGQHRLTAIAQSGVAVWSMVVRGVSEEQETFHTIGDEKSRNIMDFMRIPNSAIVVNVVRTWHGLINGKWPLKYGEITPTAELLHLVNQWSGEIGPLIPATYNAGRLVRQAGFCVFLVFYYTKIQPIEDIERLAGFFARVGDGVGLSANHPAYQLRKKFTDLRTSSDKFSRLQSQAWILKALHLYLDHKPCMRLSYDPMREEFPRLRGHK